MTSQCQCFSHYREEEMTVTPNSGGAAVTRIVRIWENCGSAIAARRTFKPGHDAKYKSALLWAYRNDVPFLRMVDGLLQEADPMKLAKARNWGHFMTKPKKAKAKAKAKADAVFAGDHGELDPKTLEPSEVEGFHPVRVKIGRWVKDAVLVSYDDDDHVTVQYDASKGKDAKELKRVQVTRDKVVEGL